MSNQIDWPSKPFYIVSKIGLSNWALTASGNGVALQPLRASLEQLWEPVVESDTGDSSRQKARLRNMQTGKVLTCGGHHTPLALADSNGGDALQLWRVENLTDDYGVWRGINMLADWEQKINVYGGDIHGTVGTWGWDGGADNEKWAVREETGSVTVDSMVYDLEKAVSNANLPPKMGVAVVVNNQLESTPITTTVKLARQITTTTTITNSESSTTGHTYPQTFSVQKKFGKLLKVSASFSFEESDSKTVSITDEKTNSETVSDEITQEVTVPGGKIYSFYVLVKYASVTVPYSAKMHFQSSIPGTAPVSFTQTGVYAGVNAISYEVMAKELPPSAQTDAAVAPVRALAQGTI